MIPEGLTKSIILTKRSKKTKSAELLGAFGEDDVITVSLFAPRALGLSSPHIEIYDDDRQKKTYYPLLWTDLKGDCETYEIKLCLSRLCEDKHSGLFFWTVVSDSAYGKIRISCDVYSYRPKVLYENESHDSFVLTVYEKGFRTPDWIKGGIMYHIFVDRFAKGGQYPVRSDAVMNEDWDRYMPQYAEIPGGEVENNMFFGGTLTGICEKLDYIASLGISCIYLSPIFEAYSNHKYDTGDYEKVDEMFGGNAALDRLIDEASKRDIRIILDGVFNHTGDDSKYFNKRGRYKGIGACDSPDSPYFKWYDFKSYPDTYRCWWDIKILPAVNTKDPDYNAYINGDDGIVPRYIKKGTSGWRLDVADELYEPFLCDLRGAAKKADPESLIIGEVWEDASIKIAYTDRRKYFRGRELDSVMNYPLRTGIIRFIETGDKEELFFASACLYSRYPKQVSDCLMNFLGTHDTERILTVLGVGNLDMTMKEKSLFKMNGEQRARALTLIRLAYTILAFMPGIPCIFYGDEAGVEGLGDPFNRSTYPWGREDKELLFFYRELGRIRRSKRILRGGYLRVIEDTPSGIFAFERFDLKGNLLLVAVNRSENAYDTGARGENLISHLFGCEKSSSVIPPLSAGLWQIKAAKIEIPK